MGICQALNEAVKVDYSKITPEILTKAMEGLDREITKQGDDYVMYTSKIGFDQFQRLMKNHNLIETLKKL